MKIKILAHIIYCFVRLLNFTYRYKFVGLENKKKARELHAQKAFVYATWHQNLIAGIFSHIGEQFTMIVSESKDGELVAVTCENFGHKPARGSSTRGGKKALTEMVRFVRSGIPGAITVDGPKGPPHIVKPGVIEVARLSQCAILPLSTYAKRSWVITKSWDQFRIPKPFTKIVVVIGEPVLVSEDVTREQFEKIALDLAVLIDKGEEVAISHL